MGSMLSRWTVLVLLPLVTGCNWLTPLVFVGEHKKRITPEFDKLAKSRVAVLVWTDQATLFDYPHARFELATYTSDKLYAEMAQRDLGTETVDPRDVEDFLQRNIEAQVDPQAVGRHFEADHVLWIEVYRFQIRDPEQPQFLHGRIDASVVVYDMRSNREFPERYELAPVECVYPDSAILMNATNSRLVRESVYRKFAEQVARKFYEHTVDL
jgi:hypothetical protein